MEYVTLNDGVKMPLLGYGVFQGQPAEAERCVSDAISVGCRLIDTAQAYHNGEGVGNAVAKSGISRNDIQITTSPGDSILYLGNRVTIYYDVNGWTFTCPMHVDGATRVSMKSFLGDGNVSMTFSLTD